MRNALTFAGSLAASLVIAVIWWRAWMYHGFIAPPQLIGSFVGGESSYNATFTEMLLVSFAFVIALIYLVRRHR